MENKSNHKPVNVTNWNSTKDEKRPADNAPKIVHTDNGKDKSGNNKDTEREDYPRGSNEKGSSLQKDN